MLRHYDEIIPHFFDHLENMFLEGWVYVTPPFELHSQDYLRSTHLYFYSQVKLLNNTLELLKCMNLYKFLNVIDDDGYDVIYYVNVNSRNV
jgi:hypothetical protein